MNRRNWLSTALASFAPLLSCKRQAGAAPAQRVNLLRVGVVNSNDRLYTPEMVKQYIDLVSPGIPICLKLPDDVPQRPPYLIGWATDFSLGNDGILSANILLSTGKSGDLRTDMRGIGRMIGDVFHVEECAGAGPLMLLPKGQGATWPGMK